jgi:predicted HTH transcriptional regulator
MGKDFFIKLTNDLYKLTLLFPKKEPLRYKMRELADEILIKPSSKSLEALNSFFEIAKNQNWVSPSDILKIQAEYDNLMKELEGNKVVTAEFKTNEKETMVGSETQSFLSQRHEKIMSLLKENSQAQVWQVKQFFPEVSKRTLRRDLEYLLKQGMIERIGERNDTFYQIKRHEV